MSWPTVVSSGSGLSPGVGSNQGQAPAQRYSGWVTGTYYNLTTGQCWWGIDGYHYEVR
ncbi:hypothetical protein ABZ860_11160 [Microbispora sp. NPDC046973]|uniref:hypothetical protein n=1 Tax=Microbispora sp. NPDC046973 TaxID=3155022 RepID=UPI0033D43649